MGESMAEHELVGKRAPKYRVHPVGKSSRQAQDWKEITDPKKPTAFLWWTPTCSSCKPALDVFAKYAKRLGSKVNFVTVCTAASQPPSTSFPRGTLHLAGDFCDGFGAQDVPYAAVVGKRGKIAMAGTPEPVMSCGGPALCWEPALRRVLPKLQDAPLLVTPAEQKAARRLFQKMDTSKDGQLSKDEIVSTMTLMGWKICGGPQCLGPRCQDLIQKFDIDGSGGISSDEFLALYNHLQLLDLDLEDAPGMLDAARQRVSNLIQDSDEVIGGVHHVITRDPSRIKELVEQLIQQDRASEAKIGDALASGGAYRFEFVDSDEEYPEPKVFFISAEGQETCVAWLEWKPDPKWGKIQNTCYWYGLGSVDL